MEKTLSFEYVARYHTMGNLTENTRRIWFVCHGYGQLAAYFIKKFEVLDPDENYIVAPEGLSRFYRDGFNGRVGACWMTRENRLTEIHNYVNYLNHIYQQEIKGVELTGKQIYLLGFSQGAATVSRWAAAGALNIDKMILWGGMFPPDVEIESERINFRYVDMVMVYGKNDELIKPEQLQDYLHGLQARTLNPRIIEYDGGHDLDEEVLLNL